MIRVPVFTRRLSGPGVVVMAALSVLLFAAPTTAQDEEPVTVSVQGRIQGGKHLLNTVWTLAADPANHRYTFRAPSTTVSRAAKKLSAYLPKELCIAALSPQKAAPKGQPIPIHISGGRTTPTTLVVAEGQNVQFINDDPFPHKLFDSAHKQGGLGAEETKPTGQRIWKPPAAGSYEVRDEYFPSIHSWIVVEPRAAGVGFPKILKPTEFIVPDLQPGHYQLRGYFMGEAVGKPIEIDLRPAPALQPIATPLVVASKKKGG